MYQPRRLSPASSSPLYRNVNVQQQNQIKLQLKQITPTNNIPPYVQIISQNHHKQNTYSSYENNSRKISKERESSQSNQSKDQIFNQYQNESLFQHHTQSLIQKSEINQVYSYIDNIYKTQKSEIFKVLDHQNKQIEFLQQIILNQTQQQQNTASQFLQLQTQLEENLSNFINKQIKDLSNRLQNTYKTELEQTNKHIEKLRAQIFQINITNSKLITEKLQTSSFNGTENLIINHSQSHKPLLSDNQTHNLDQNIKIIKNNYLIDKDYQTQSHYPLNDITNIQMKYIKSLQSSLQNSKLSKCSSSNNNKNQQEGSPIELFNEQNVLDSLDNIKVFDPQLQQQSDIPSDTTNNQLSMDLSQARMSTIQENENEEDECIYQIVENHQNQTKFKNLKKSKDQINTKQSKSKTLYY
ncbi:unnamed protein product [Paramecium pentaurelia]|uniref:Uncharacterized protein n=1 Tax=Paramecium pentaurelia TaxID=43138 RepID=A0A8S1VLD3_9CILI|nr:unnamed protein product [Paramecium pentaurelia]